MSTYRMIPPIIGVLPSLLGLFAAVVMAGWPVGQAPAVLETTGLVRLIDGGLALDSGATVNFGTGRSIAMTVMPAEKSFELYWGDMTKPTVVARVGSRTGLYDENGAPYDGAVDANWRVGQRVQLVFWCQGSVKMEIDGRVVGRATPPQVCSTAPLSVRTANPIQLHGLRVDDTAVPLHSEGFDVAASVRAAVFLGLGVAVLGATGWGWLILTLVGLNAPALGVSTELVWWIVVTLAFGLSARHGVRWRRRARAFGGLSSGLIALSAFWFNGVPVGLGDWGLSRLSIPSLISQSVGIESYMAKVETAEEFYAPRLSQRDPEKPLVVILGSSSSGGNSGGRFWPQVLQEELPHAHVQSLAWGGATTWHMRKLIERLDVEPEVCVLYIGHNDLTPSFPAQSLGSLERGEEPTSTGFVAPVPVEEAEDNVVAISQRCGKVLAMQEHSTEQMQGMLAYARMLANVPGVTWANGAALLEEEGDDVMKDEIHPNVQGHQILAGFVASKIGPWLN